MAGPRFDYHTLARALGIERLAVGRQFLPDEHNFAAGSAFVDALWLLEVTPSFHCDRIVGVLSAQGAAVIVTSAGPTLQIPAPEHAVPIIA